MISIQIVLHPCSLEKGCNLSLSLSSLALKIARRVRETILLTQLLLHCATAGCLLHPQNPVKEDGESTPPYTCSTHTYIKHFIHTTAANNTWNRITGL